LQRALAFLSKILPPKTISFLFIVWRRVNFRRFDVCFCSAHFYAHTSNPISIVLLLAYGKYFYLSVCIHINCFVLASVLTFFRSYVWSKTLGNVFGYLYFPILCDSIFGQVFSTFTFLIRAHVLKIAILYLFSCFHFVGEITFPKNIKNATLQRVSRFIFNNMGS